MAYEILEIDNEIIRVRISGVMRLADQKELQKAASDLIDWGLKPRLLIMAENFEGWEKRLKDGRISASWRAMATLLQRWRLWAMSAGRSRSSCLPEKDCVPRN